MSHLRALENYGQSIWLDYIRRNLLTGGELHRLIEEDGVSGLTSNPAMFEKAIVGSVDYAAAIEKLADEPVAAESIYEQLAIDDVRQAADVMAPVYGAGNRRDGYVSLEVSPRLANDTEGTCEEARRLWKAVARPNLMIKVPATADGIPAIETLIAEGINVNVTLLFSTKTYEKVVEAYFCGLEKRLEVGADAGQVASVASFFVSRIDTAVDNLIEERLAESVSAPERMLLRSLRGKVAIANARLTYQRYKEHFSGERWNNLVAKGARTQRLLWASTGNRNPAYTDVLYLNELIGPDTINTVPPATLDAFRDHGSARPSLEEDLEAAQDVIDSLWQMDISIDHVTDRLLNQGVRLFVEAFDKLLTAVEKARTATVTASIDRQRYVLPPELQAALDVTLAEWQSEDKVRRLWARDPSLWTGSDEGRWLDWLEVTRAQTEHLGNLSRVIQMMEGKYFKDAVLLGMGGSSLAPEVIRATFGTRENHPNLHVLDSTDPAEIKAIEDRIDYAHTLFIVSSKSGSTLEPNILKQHFFARASEAVGPKLAARHFAAITDPGSKLQHVAEGDGFRQIFFGKPGIGGRYSALSNFGMVPAGAIGVDLRHFLEKAEEMVEACASCVPARENPGVVLGAILGEAAVQGRDKITIVASPGISGLGVWIEQLLAESTGKDGKGLIPVVGEKLGPPESYEDDRVFVYLRLTTGTDPAQGDAISRLEETGHPVVRIRIPDRYNLGQEFFRWEMATAVAGSILGINAFNQPDVEASKVVARKLTKEYETTGSLPTEVPLAQSNGIQLFADQRNAAELRSLAGEEASIGKYLTAHLSRLRHHDYFAVLAYLARNEEHEGELQSIRQRVRDTRKVATCLGYGPRYLHSTGQAYKGGPNTGVFLQVTCDDAEDLPVPGQKYTFGVVKAAQAQGDLKVLAARRRRALRVHVGADTMAGLGQLRKLVAEGLAAETAR